jgi:AhpD family alkylhydroperoxidase
MNPRFDDKSAPGMRRALAEVERYLASCGLEKKLLDLVRLRSSQMNGCAFCIDMHWKDLRAAGESEQRLYGLDAWRESPYYSDRERAALAWTEAVTLVAMTHVPHSVFEQVKPLFSESELANLTLAIGMINLWNRIYTASREEPGKYRVGQLRAAEAGELKKTG